MDIDGMQDVCKWTIQITLILTFHIVKDGDLNDFERRVAGDRNAYKVNPKDDSSDEEVKVDRTNPV